MNIALLVAGIAVLVAGLLAMGLGIEEKEFEVGKTLILSGTIAACTGFIVLGLVAAIAQLREIARRLGPAQAAANQVAGRRPRTEPQAQALPGPVAGVAADAPLFTQEPPAVEPVVDADAPPSAPPPWQEEATRARQRGNMSLPPEAPPVAAEPAADAKPRRNLLFSSSSRKERERAAARSGEAAPEADSGLSPPPLPEPAPRTFEDAWPAPDPGRSDTLRRGGRSAPTTASDAGAAPAQPAAEERNQVTVLKSGVVDGMAYSLYSDGSIEAQMPEGMMRFASIAELREHLEQRP